MIPFTAIVYSSVLFIIIFIFHVLVWRVLKPKKQITYLFFLFIFIPVLVLFSGVGLSALCTVKLFSLYDVIPVLLLYLAFSGVYIQTYPAIQAWAPSLLLVYIIGRNKTPVSKKVIQKYIRKEELIVNKIYELEQEGFITIGKRDKFIVLTIKGKILAGIFLFYRKILGLKEGEG